MGGSKRGALVAAAALAVVLVAGLVGYRLMAGRQTTQATAQQQMQKNAEESGAKDAEVRGDEASSEASNNASDGPTDERDLPQLADYDATVYSADGESFLLSDIASGRPLVINFWASWCPYCVQEMPDYQQLVSEYGDRVSFAFVDQTDGSRETVETARMWLSQNGFDDLPVYYDTALDASSAFGASSLPTSVVVSADGSILGAFSGAIRLDTMRSTLDALV